MPYDERDVLFSRLNYAADKEVYADYYTKHPQREEGDKESREIPPMGNETSQSYNRYISPLPDACFDYLAAIKQFANGAVSPVMQEGTPEMFTEVLLGLAKYYGAKLVGIAELTPNLYYSHKGRPNELYNQEIDPKYKYGIVFAVEMEEDIVNTAPSVVQSLAATKGYVQAATIGMVLSYYIRSLGYKAFNNMDGNYLMPLPPVAQEAGIGEMGLSGLLITPQYGPRIRLGVVATNIPLIANTWTDKGIRQFCEMCKRCKRHCYGKAIDNAKGGNERGFNDNACMKMWQKYGSDCGRCLSVCPFAHNLPQDIVANLTTHQGRIDLVSYCNKHFKIPPDNTNLPPWLDLAMKTE